MESKKEVITVDWLVKILISIVAFFMVGIFLTVNKTATDVNELKTRITVLQYQYNNLDSRIKKIENSKNF